MKSRQLFELSLIGIAILLVTPGDALAYVDPGTGSYLFQLLIAGGLAGVYTLRRYWDGLKTLLTRNGGRSEKSRPDRPHGMA